MQSLCKAMGNLNRRCNPLARPHQPAWSHAGRWRASAAGLKLFAVSLGPVSDAVGHVKKPGLLIVAAAREAHPAFVVGQILVAGI